MLRTTCRRAQLAYTTLVRHAATSQQIRAPSTHSCSAFKKSRPLSICSVRSYGTPAFHQNNERTDKTSSRRSDSSLVHLRATYIGHTDDQVKITWSDGVSHSFSNLWLRDHCRCSQCYHGATHQRMSDIYNCAPSDLNIIEIRLSEEKVSVSWSDGHTSSFDAAMLRRYSSSTRKYERRRFWTADVAMNVPSIPYSVLMDEKNDHGVRECLRTLRNYGFAFVDGVPSALSSIEEAVSRLAPPMDSWFGKMWTFDNQSLDHADMAYTGYALASHTDGCYLYDPPGLQIFQCLELTGENTGGLTTLVDGFSVAERIRREDPDAYEILSTASLPYEYIDRERGLHHMAWGPCLTHDSYTGEIVQVRYNTADRAILEQKYVDMASINDLYRALLLWEHRLRESTQVYATQLTSGRMLIIDNWRVLHGRTSVNPSAKRTIGGCNVKRADYLNAMRQSGLDI